MPRVGDTAVLPVVALGCIYLQPVSCKTVPMHRSVRRSTPVPGIEVISIISDRTFPRHSHDEFGIGVLVDGVQESWSGRGMVEAKAGDIITVNPGELHDGIGQQGRPRHWRMLFLSPGALAHVAGYQAEAFEIEHPVLQKHQARAAILNAIAAATNEHPDIDEIEEAVLLAIHAVSDRFGLPNEGDPPSRSPSVMRVLERIETEADTPLSLEDYAATSGLSRFQILRRFAQEVGTTPHGYLVQHRVKLARRAIAAGLTLAEAAAACGFADQSHMTRAFVRQIGISPGRYRSG
jgi:AraC-like DNA-binding protein